ncbi:hypothetical protein H5U35_04070 [Candidatus Aerophobetes bacterium]|nr:hypothetical protein [Candidatus Aerophobetes bacterium]
MIRGFTIIELVIALFIVSFSLIGLVAVSLKTKALVEETKRAAQADKFIVGQMEDVRASGITDADDSIICAISSESVSGTYTLNLFEVISSSSNWTSSVFPNKQTRTITFYVYKKGLSWRP